MYAVVTTGGKQYRVEAGSELIVERLAAEPGASITFDRVLLVGDGEAVTVGSPIVDGASVSGTVLGEELGPKLIIFKFKQKVKYRRTAGHRQHLTRVRIDEISAGGKRETADQADEAKKAEAADSTDKTDTVEAAAAEEASVQAEPAEEGSVQAEPAAKPARARKATTPKAKATADAGAGEDDGPRADAGAGEVEAPKAKPATRRRSTVKKAEAEE